MSQGNRNSYTEEKPAQSLKEESDIADIPKTALDVGCGQTKIPEAIGIDRVSGPNVDIVHDIRNFPWPFENDTFTFVRLNHIIEHVSDILKTMEEVHRICKAGAQVHIETPHFSSMNSWTDPTHCQHLAYNSMEIFTKYKRYNYVSYQYEYKERKITFGKSLLCLPGKLICAISPDWYERHFCFIFPARDLIFSLVVLK